MKIKAIVQARMNASRLPGKVLLPACGRHLLDLLIERAYRSTYIEEVWVATTTHSADQSIVDFCETQKISIFRGSEENVLERVAQCALHSQTDLMVELTGDNPLIDPKLIDDEITAYKKSKCDLVTNVFKSNFAPGMVAQVVSTETLQKMLTSTSDPLDQEHVMRYILKRPNRFSICHLNWPEENPRPDLRLTVDAPQDYKLVKNIFETLYPQKPDFNFADICNYLDDNLDLIKINQHITQKRY